MACGTPGNNYTWSDPPLNTSTTDNPYYHNTGGTNGNWVINESGHVWQLDGANSSSPNYISAINTFLNFGPTFAILINASNVIFDGMGATLHGGWVTEYGIIVNNQTAKRPGRDIARVTWWYQHHERHDYGIYQGSDFFQQCNRGSSW